MALVTEKINNTAQANLTNQQLIEGYIGNEEKKIIEAKIDKLQQLARLKKAYVKDIVNEIISEYLEDNEPIKS